MPIDARPRRALEGRYVLLAVRFVALLWVPFYTRTDLKSSVYALDFARIHFSAYEAVFALVANLIVMVGLTALLRAIGVRDRADETRDDDYFELRHERARRREPELAH